MVVRWPANRMQQPRLSVSTKGIVVDNKSKFVSHNKTISESNVNFADISYLKNCLLINSGPSEQTI